MPMQQGQYLVTQPAYRINTLQFLETGTYNDMYRRPYQTNVSRQTLSAFQEATHNGTRVDVNDVAAVAGDILHPSAQVGPRDRIDIPNGWNEKRFLFMMEIIYPTNNSFMNGLGVRQLVSGYTDHPGASNITGLHVHLDPQMRLYINSVVTLRQTVMATPFGEQIVENVTDASQLLSEIYPPNYQGGFGQTPMISGFMPAPPDQWTQTHLDIPVTMRPEDVFHVNETNMMPDQFGLIDARYDFRQGARKTHRKNNLPAHYVSQVAQAFQTSAAQNFEEGNKQDLLTHAAGLVREPMMVKDKFLSLINDRTGFSQTGFVTYGELCRMQPDLDNIADVRYQDKRSLVPTYSSFDSEGWSGANMETVIATSLFQTVPAIMTQMMISRLIISVTNRTTTGEFVVTPSQIMGFKSMPIDEQIFNILVMRLKTQVLHSLSQGNQIDIAFNLTIDIAGDSRLEISLNGQPFVPYVVPSFADARFTPVIANGYRALEGVAHDMGVLCDNLTVNYGTRPVSNIDTISGFGSPQQSFNPQGIDYTSKV